MLTARFAGIWSLLRCFARRLTSMMARLTFELFIIAPFANLQRHKEWCAGPTSFTSVTIFVNAFIIGALTSNIDLFDRNHLKFILRLVWSKFLNLVSSSLSDLINFFRRLTLLVNLFDLQFLSFEFHGFLFWQYSGQLFFPRKSLTEHEIVPQDFILSILSRIVFFLCFYGFLDRDHVIKSNFLPSLYIWRWSGWVWYLIELVLRFDQFVRSVWIFIYFWIIIIEVGRHVIVDIRNSFLYLLFIVTVRFNL